MHWFVPYLDTPTFERALREAARLAQPGDCVTVMAPVVVPGDLPVDVDAGVIWKQVCRAERHLFYACETAERLLPTTVTVSFVRIQARNLAAAISAGAVYDDADRILLAQPQGIRGTLSARFGTIAAVKRQAPCPVHIVGAVADVIPRDEWPVHATARTVTESFAEFRTIAVNPALASRETRSTQRKSEEQHAS